jgi:hypothetical protein
VRKAKLERLLRISAGGVRLTGDDANAATEFSERRLTCSETHEGAELRQRDVEGVEQGADDVKDAHVAIPSGKQESQDDHPASGTVFAIDTLSRRPGAPQCEMDINTLMRTLFHPVISEPECCHGAP